MVFCAGMFMWAHMAKLLEFSHQFPKCKCYFIALFRIECWKFWLSSWNAAYEPTFLGPTTWWSLFKFLPSYTLMFFSISLFVSWVLLCRKNSKLHISRVRLEDSGNYTCVAENSLGRENATSYVSIQSSKSSIISLFANGWESQETTCSSWGIFFCLYFIFTTDMLYKMSVL